MRDHHGAPDRGPDGDSALSSPKKPLKHHCRTKTRNQLSAPSECCATTPLEETAVTYGKSVTHHLSVPEHPWAERSLV